MEQDAAADNLVELTNGKKDAAAADEVSPNRAIARVPGLISNPRQAFRPVGGAATGHSAENDPI